jgi:hypothetical protein
LAKTISIKPEEAQARSFADRLILSDLVEHESAVKLSELADRLSKSGLNLVAVRSLLASNPQRFAYHERRWVPASRIEGAGKPLVEVARIFIDRNGVPIPISQVAQEYARIRGLRPEDVRDQVEQVLRNDPSFIVIGKADVALADWAYLASEETEERGFALYGISKEEVDQVCLKLGNFDWRAPDAIEKALRQTAPVSAKAFSACAWLALNPQDPKATLLYDGREFFAELVSTPGFVFGADGLIYPEAETKKWISAAVKLADRLAPTVEVEDAAPVDVKDADVQKMIKRITGSNETNTATQLLADFYEITTANKTFPDDLANVMGALQSSPEVWWVGGDRFRKPNSAPDYVFSVPEPFQYPPSPFLDEEGEPVDIELTDEGLSSSLRKLLAHPLATDVLDEEIQPAAKNIPITIRLVLRSVHRELGTFPMCQVPTGWLEQRPNVQEFIFRDPTGRELQVWANFEARLFYDLLDWWFDQAVESGAVFTLTKTDKPNVFEFAWEDQPDPLLYISTQRIEQLRELQSRSAEMSVKDILIEAMHHWPKGADFLTLLAEMNVVRRTTRRMVASILSSYQCFYQRSGSPVWHFDAKKVDLGFDKTKRKFVKK